MTRSRKAGNKFYIIGPRRLQNELIASHLEQITGNVCNVLEQINLIPKNNPRNPNHSNFVLWDCQGKDPKNLMSELTSYTPQSQSSNCFVLFNVPTYLDLKKKFVLNGIHGFFYEHDSLEIFLKGLRAILDGKLWLSREMMTKCIFEANGKNKSLKNTSRDLTQRQIQILALVAVGATNDEISDKLCISPHTVKAHLYRIFRKINVPNRVQASLWAAQNL
jgi:DNA-binding CsgD family transcriptional regulator